MEDMVPELEDLEKRGFFSAAELKQIAQKRTDFEYLLKRRAPLKADYLRWVASAAGTTLALSLVDHACSSSSS